MLTHFAFELGFAVLQSSKGQVLQKTIDESIGADDFLHQRSQSIISQNQLVLNSEEVSYK